MSNARLTDAFAALSRRSMLSVGLSAAALAVAAPALAQKGPAQIPVDELMKTDLPDIIVGKADAPVTIVEYASMTCGHCAAFHLTVLPKLKEKYIDTGKAKLIFREFPLDNVAAAVSMLGRCLPADASPAFVGEMFKRQGDWAFQQGNPLPRGSGLRRPDCPSPRASSKSFAPPRGVPVCAGPTTPISTAICGRRVSDFWAKVKFH